MSSLILVADQLGHSVDINVKVHAKTGFTLRKQALDAMESAVAGAYLQRLTYRIPRVRLGLEALRWSSRAIQGQLLAASSSGKLNPDAVKITSYLT